MEEIDDFGYSSVPVEQRKRLTLFVVKLLDIIEGTDDNVIRWGDCETSFIVEKPHELSKVLATCFKSSKFASFARQLNFYGFHKLVKSEHKNEFTHKNFRRGDWDALALIKRKQSIPREPARTPTMRTKRQMDELVKAKGQAERERDHMKTKLAKMKSERDAARREAKQLQQQLADLEERLRQAQAAPQPAPQSNTFDALPLAPAPAPAPFDGGLLINDTKMKLAKMADPTYNQHSLAPLDPASLLPQQPGPVLDDGVGDLGWLIDLPDLDEVSLDI